MTRAQEYYQKEIEIRHNMKEEENKLQIGYMTMEGYRSLDRRIAKLVAYVNEHINNPKWDKTEAIAWGKKTVEQGIKNIANNTFAYLVE